MCWAEAGYGAPPEPIPDPLLGPGPTTIGTNGAGFHPRRVLVKPRRGAFANPAALHAGIASLHASLGARSLHAFPQIGDLEVLEIPKGRAVGELLQKYRSSPLVEYAEPDYEYKAFAVPNDPAFPQLWGLQNTGANGGVVGADIHASGGWDIRTSASNVIVAITDTGIRLTHEDLAANLWANPGEVPGNGRDDDGDGYVDDVHGINVITGSGDPTDDFGHGTHVAGIIGAVGNNGKGVAGVAWQVQLMALKWLDSSGRGYSSDAILCLDYARAKGASIVNASWGGPYYSRALYDAIASLRANGIIFVAAAGNDGMDNGQYFPYPASYPLDNIVAVAASDRADQLAFFSDYGGATVDLAAPGQEILSTWYTGDSDYALLSGTSMAAPHVAGALALLQAQLPAENYLARIYRLYGTADPLPGLAGKCLAGGRLNLQRALTSTLQTTPLNGQFANRTPLSGIQITAFGSNVGATGASPNQLQTAETSSESLSPLRSFVANPESAPQGPELIANLATKAHKEHKEIFSELKSSLGEAGTTNIQTAVVPASHPVWWTWTAPQSGRATIKTTGSSFDTMLKVYTGTDLASLVLVADNNDTDVPADGAVTSKVVFETVAGTPYQIQVDGKAGAVGAIRLGLAYTTVPPNDAFANRNVLSGKFIAARGSNVGASKEAEPAHAGDAGGASVWWTWQAPVSGPFVLTTAGSTFDTLLAVYTGEALQSLTPVISNNDEPNGDFGGLTSEVRFDTVAGHIYQIAVDGVGGQSGQIKLAGGYQYLLTEIYPLSRDNSTVANDLNDLGEVCGSSYYNSNLGSIRNGFLWKNGVVQNLGELEESGNTEAFGLNNLGQVVGWTGITPPGSSFAVSHAFTWVFGTGMVRLDPMEDPNLPSYGSDLNDSGAQCGGRWTPWSNGISYSQAFRWTPDQGVALLGTLGGPTSDARRINAAGEIVGRAAVDATFTFRACLWRLGSSILDLGTLGGSGSSGTGLNDLGQVIGASSIRVSSLVSHAFLWQNGVMVDLGTINFSRNSTANGINTNGQIVGAAFYSQADLHATFWQNGEFIDLNRLVEPSLGWVLERATAINNRGEIVGYGMHNGQRHAFLLTPFTFQMAKQQFVKNSTQFQFELVGPNGRNYRVESTSDFTNWTAVATGTFPVDNKSVIIIDPARPTPPQRFYRASME